MNPARPWLLTAVCAALGAGCAGPDPHGGRDVVSGQLQQRTGSAIGVHPGDGQLLIPTWAGRPDGVSDEEAVCLALWNNAAFQELLADLGLARADLIQAGLIANPDLWLLTPVGPKQLEFAFNFPLEALWLRPRRVAAARLEESRVAERLVQAGLDLVRDVKVACAEVRLARDRVRVANEIVRVREQTARLAAARLRAGDATPLDEATARIDLLRAREEARRLVWDINVAEERLRLLLGFGPETSCLTVADAPLPDGPKCELAALIAEAVETRPAARSARFAIEAAEERARLARWDYLLLAGIIDANGRGEKGFEIGPGFRVTLPIFNRNEGARARAEADAERLRLQYRTVRDRITLEVREAHVRWLQAREDLELWRTQVLPAAEQAVRHAENAYKEGETNLLIVLDTTRQLLDARFRETQARNDLRRALAELERGVGHRLDQPCGAPPP